MKKLGKIGLLIITLLAIAAMLCGCSASKSVADKAELSTYYDYPEEAVTEEMEEAPAAEVTSKQVTDNRKIIEYVDLTVETKTFDALIDKINAAVEQSGGYIESSQIGGNSYYGYGNRSAELKIRIPKTKQTDFSDFLSENSNVVNRSVNTDDVTNQYIDIQSRIKALTLEKETLEKLLTQSDNVSDTLTVYEELTNVIAEIESYQSRLKQMDNLIDYTTFTVRIIEVEKVTVVEKENWFAKTWNGLVNNLSDVGKGLLNFCSFMISALPYWIILGAVAAAVVLIIRRCKKKKSEKKLKADKPEQK